MKALRKHKFKVSMEIWCIKGGDSGDISKALLLAVEDMYGKGIKVSKIQVQKIYIEKGS